MAEQKVKILSSTPIVAVDGHGIGVSEDKQFVNIQFLQITGKNPDTEEVSANIVSSTRFTKEQVLNLQKDLSKAIDELEK